MTIYNEMQYINMINDFFNNFSNSALLIEGEWGSGKTYFIKNKFKESLSKNDVFIYISLYGMSTIDDINRYYLDSIFEEEYIKRLKTEKGVKISMKMFELIKNSNRVFDIFLNKEDLKKFLRKDKSYYIVLDDLERCNIDLSVLLGFINNLTDQENNNVIVIANENELGKLSTKSDLEQKYIVSLLADKIEVDEPNFLNLSGKDNKFTEIKTLKQLNLKTDAIFNNDINFIYKNFKEKTFGKTITYLSNIDEIYDESIQNLSVNSIKMFLVDNKESILEKFKSNNISNLRILEKCMKTFERFDYIFRHFKEYDKFNEFKKIFIKSVIMSEINHSKGFDKQFWGSKGEYYEVSDSFEIFTSFITFKFLDDYIWNSFINEQNTIEIIESFFASLKKEFVNDPINRIKYFWQMEDQEIEENIREIIKGLMDSLYPSSLFEEIFTRLINIKEIGFDVDIDHVLELMSNSTNNDSNIYEDMTSFEIDHKGELYIKNKDSFERIKNIREHLTKYQYIEVLDNIFSNNFWSNDLNAIYRKNKKYFYDSKQFLNFLDFDELINNLETSLNSNFVEFIKCINSIYPNNMLVKDREHLVKLNDYLKTTRFQSKIKDSNRTEALKIFERIISSFE